MLPFSEETSADRPRSTFPVRSSRDGGRSRSEGGRSAASHWGEIDGRLSSDTMSTPEEQKALCLTLSHRLSTLRSMADKGAWEDV